MPAYNESACLAQNAKFVLDILSNPSDPSIFALLHILIVNDGSTDNTQQIAESLAAQDSRFVSISYQPNRGKGGALREGSAHATADLVAFLDADLDLHPSLLFALSKAMQTKNADAAIGSKHHPNSNIAFPLYRKIYSRIYAILIHWLFALPVRDTQTGIKLFKRQALAQAMSRSSICGFAFDLELLSLIVHDKFKVVEVPVTVTSQRPAGRIGAKDVARMLRDTLSLWFRMRSARLQDITKP